MIRVVTVKKPITGPLRNPRNGSRVTRIKTFGNNHVALRTVVINDVVLTIAATVDAEVKTMKVQRVAFESRIDPTPVHCLTLSVSEALCIRPRSTVDNCHLASDKWAALIVIPEDVDPNANDENLFTDIRLCTGRIDHDCARELRILTVPFFERAIGGCTPVVIRARKIETEGNLTGLSKPSCQFIELSIRRWVRRKTMDRQRRARNRIFNRCADLGSGWNSYEWSRDLQLPAARPKCLYRDARLTLASRIPHTGVGD